MHEAEIDRLFDADKRGLVVFQIAQSLGFKGEFRQWEELLRTGLIVSLPHRSRNHRCAGHSALDV